MKNFNLGAAPKHTEAENKKPRIYLTLGKETESHFNQGKQRKKTDISDTVDIQTKIDLDDGLVNFRETLFDYFKIGIGTVDSTDGLSIDYSFVGETVQMVFLIKGEASLFMFDRSFRFKANECNIFFGIETEGVSVLDKDENTFLLIDIQKNFFTRFFPKYKHFQDFTQQIQDHQAGYIRNQNLPLTPEMLLLINSIIDCKRTDHFRKIHMHAKVMELLLLQLDLLKMDVKRTESVSACNMAKMQIAHNYLSENYRNPMTLTELARKIGTNEFLLKRDFKTLFGTTVFRYVADVRMKSAKTLLLEGELSIGQISDEVGYKNPQHFSTAFKRKFGMSPSSVQNSRNKT